MRIALGLVFLYAGIGKIAAPREFAGAIENYRVFGSLLSNWAAVFIPALELLLAVLLISGLWAGEALALTCILYLLFDIMILQAYFRGLDISCGCFSTAHAAPIGFWKFLENGLFTLAAVTAFYLRIKKSPESAGAAVSGDE